MAQLDIEKLSLASRDREKEEQKRNLRKKTILILAKHFLENNGLFQAAETLAYESKQAIDGYSVCDNIDFETILQDFESYHFLRYQKLPQIIKKSPADSSIQPNFYKGKTKKLKPVPMKPLSARNYPSEQKNNLSIEVSNRNSPNPFANNLNNVSSICEMPSSNYLNFPDGYSTEWKTMATQLIQDCCKQRNPIGWSDIVGHEKSKQLLKEAIIYPLKYSEFFKSKSSIWQSVLLYGPTGTGKTMLATVAATESKAKFFKVCVSTLISKWRGESEKFVKVLFDLSKLFSPSVIFIDEIDALISHRGSDHEASRRMKTEFFLQMDELTSSKEFVVLIGATNLPWELDHAVLRRMEKRILVDLPDDEIRVQLFKKFLINDNEKHRQTDFNFKAMAEATDGYSPADILLACKEAKMEVFRQVIRDLENKEQDKAMLKCASWDSLNTLSMLSAIERTKPATTDLIARYGAWKKSHGSE